MSGFGRLSAHAALLLLLLSAAACAGRCDWLATVDAETRATRGCR